MSVRKIHLHLCPHPAPTSDGAMDYACALAQALGARLDVSSPRISIRKSSHWLAGAMMAGMARELEERAAAAAEAMEEHLRAQVTGRNVQLSISQFSRQWPASPGESVWRGRTSDLCVLPLSPDGEQRLLVEDWLFHVGRPCLIYPDAVASAFSLDTIVVSWDCSRSAARAVADALPLLKRAKKVCIVTVRGEKDLPFKDVRTPLIDYLAAHAAHSVAEDVDIEGTTIGRAILDYAAGARADLLVMGAYGHSRTREFLLGGATKSVLDAAAIPILMSH